MKNVAFLLVLLISLAACRQKGASGDPVKFTTEKEMLDSTNIRTCRNADCSEIEVGYVRVNDSTDFGKTLNAGNAQELIKLINITTDKTAHFASVEEGVNDFVRKAHKRREDQAQSSYRLKIKQQVKSANANTVVLKTTFTITDPSASNRKRYHGMRFLNFDAHSGEYLSTHDLISDTEAFSQFVEQKLRKKYQLAPQADINSKAELFENGKFTLPKNVAVTDKAVVLLYNSYELADPEEGQIRFLFPKKAVEEYFAY